MRHWRSWDLNEREIAKALIEHPARAGTRSGWIFAVDHQRPGTFDISTPVRSGLAAHPTNGQRHFRISSNRREEHGPFDIIGDVHDYLRHSAHE